MMRQLPCLFALALSATAATIEVVPSAPLIEVGDLLTVDVNVSGLGDGVAPSLSAYSVQLNYDNVFLSFVDVDFGDQVTLPGALLPPFTDYPGAVESAVVVLEVSGNFPDELDLGQLASFRLFTVSFTALSAGVSPLTLVDLFLGDAWGDNITTAFSVVNSQVQITASDNGPGPGPGDPGDPGTVIPEPSTILMLATGFVALLLARRRWNNKSASVSQA